MSKINMNIKIICCALLVLLLNIVAKCEESGNIKSKNPFVQFRKKAEEIDDYSSAINSNGTGGPNDALVSVLVQNVKEIFGDIINTHEKPTETFDYFQESSLLFRPTESFSTLIQTSQLSNNISQNFNSADVMMYANLPLTPLPLLIDKKRSKTSPSYEEFSAKAELLHLSKDMMLLGRSSDSKNDDYIGDKLLQESNVSRALEQKRSCISCNNVYDEACSDPQHKLITSTLCKTDENLCYSLHTPFGIVERGCFNVNHNLTKYVCSCNLCNSLSLSDMPYIFQNKKEWILDVVELSKTRRLRNSVFKDMSCLSCEVKASKSGDLMNDANCIEGNIGSLPTEVCKENELCGIKAIRNMGYVWRGCLKKPLYNYWLTLCDNDLCNYEPVASILNF